MVMFTSIRWRLIASYTLLTLVAMLALGAVSLYMLDSYFTRQEQEYLTENAQAIALRAASTLWFGGSPGNLHFLANSYSFFSHTRVQILDAEGHVLADSGPRPLVSEVTVFTISRDVPGEVEVPVYAITMGGFVGSVEDGKAVSEVLIVGDEQGGQVKMSVRPGVPVLQLSASPWGVGFAHAEEGSQAMEAAVSNVAVTVPIESPDELLGYVRLSEGPAYGQSLRRSVRSALVGGLLVVVPLAVVVGILTSRSLTRPLAALGDVTQRMAAGDLSIRAPVGRRDEMGQLASRFNEMAARLEATFAALEADREALRRFAADASHELRTPITALTTFNELLQGKAGEDPATRREFLVESQAQIERLDWLTTNLLDLSKLDSGLLEMACQDCDLGELIAGTVAVFVPQAQTRDIVLEMDLPAGAVMARIDQARIEQVLSNLLSNALKFTPAGGRVTVGLARHQTSVEVWVEDSGVGIAAEDLPHVFERFYRARNSDGHPGSGLGLAIVKGIVEAHGGQVTATSQPGVGSRFGFTLPIES